MNLPELCNMRYADLCRQLGDAHIRQKLFAERIDALEKEIAQIDKAVDLSKVLENLQATKSPADMLKPPLAVVPGAAPVEDDAKPIDASQSV